MGRIDIPSEVDEQVAAIRISLKKNGPVELPEAEVPKKDLDTEPHGQPHIVTSEPE